MNDILDRITTVLVDVFDDDDLVATETLSADDVPGWDSLTHVRFILSVEREFAVRFSASEIATFANVGDLARAVAAKLN